jgi:hypothetical protein
MPRNHHGKDRNSQPLSSFDPKLLTILIEGGRKQLEFRSPDIGKLNKFVLRLRTCRRRMIDLKHPQAEIVQRSEIVLNRKTMTVTVRPHDSDFDDLISQASTSTKATLALAAVMAPPQDLLDDFIAEPQINGDNGVSNSSTEDKKTT